MLLDRLFAARSTSPGAQRYSLMLPRKSTAGIVMSEERAMTYGPVFSAVKVITETVAMLPWRAYEVKGESRELQAGSKLDHLLHRQPNSEMTAFTFREYLTQCALLWGNGYAEIEFNMMGQPVALWPLHPSSVTVERTPAPWRQLVYKITPDDSGQSVYLPPARMFHLRGPTRDGIVGRSMISAARESWGLGIAAEQFGAAHFGNGGVPGLIIQETAESTKEMSPEAIANMLESFDRRHGGASRAGRSSYLEKDFKIEKVGMPHKDAQFIESRKFQVTEVARWFRLPPHKIGDMEKATYSNIEQQSIDFVMDSIYPWTQRLEQEADMKLHADPNIITKINLLGLLRGDSEMRAKFYKDLWGIGVHSINDVRRLEDMNPVEGGDQRFVPLNMIPLEQASEGRVLDSPNAMRSVLNDAHARLIWKETQAATRAIDQGKDMQRWVQSFYPQHKLQLIEALRPGCEAVAEMLIITEEAIESSLETHCQEFVEASMRDIAAEASLSKWEYRATAATDQLLQRLAGAKKR